MSARERLHLRLWLGLAIVLTTLTILPPCAMLMGKSRSAPSDVTPELVFEPLAEKLSPMDFPARMFAFEKQSYPSPLKKSRTLALMIMSSSSLAFFFAFASSSARRWFAAKASSAASTRLTMGPAALPVLDCSATR